MQKYNDDDRLDTTEAAEVLNRAVVTLAKWRCEGYGPPYEVDMRRVYYRYGDLLAFARANRRRIVPQNSGALL